MRAMVLDAPGVPLRAIERPEPRAGPGQRLLRVRACGVCRTDLHLRDGELDLPVPRILGHQIVAVDPDGQRIGVPWLGWTCGECTWCRSGRENLCPNARFTGRNIDGGFAELTVADERYCFPLPDDLDDEHAAPLLCGGLIGYRALRMCGDARRVGLYGFGSAAHVITQVAVAQGREVFAFTRAGDKAAQTLAREVGASWASPSEYPPPEPLDAAIIFAPVGALVPLALRAVEPGGTVVCGGIHMSEIPPMAHEDLVARADTAVGRQPDPGRRAGAARARPHRPGPHARHDLPARAGRAGTRRPARGAGGRVGGGGSVTR